MDPFSNTGELEKLLIQAFKDEKCQQPVSNDGSMKLMLNPESFSTDFSIDYASNQVPGESGANKPFVKIRPGNFEFEFLFDRTGAIPNAAPQPGGVFTDIDKLKKVVSGFNSETHEVPYLKIAWGKLVIHCKLVSIQVTFKLFKPDGTPLRATARCGFEQFQDIELRVAIENLQSPDVSHLRAKPTGEHLPYMTYKIYGDSKHYIEVARANGIVHFRNIPDGSSIYFPPMEK